ncbi:substrate-binding domain-containing protein [Phyllobacterium sp. 0TCS1.6C]|uniref:LacI family DNA-binding transcriptional regulator n=1 Tax=unclassified Phyllobacterium TaxID=2638441 RepID=UPI00226525B9|nr:MULTISPECIES: substrate-binding domain-containing protein [unclassified Phyllobacterium]MCX8279000.1 substrate-binding domain-containing protein [Phyllobacterium sp. 0TCS1.6C]MCX8293784.1 substrate-binding domain-containing protein [Phyllobacterium sp. 0TCS1.6A]
MKPTAKQVAHEADVSISAVSRAFSPGSSIDPAKRQRILQVAAQLGYTSPARRTAEIISAGTVTLVAGDLANPFYPLVLDTLAKALQAVGRQLLVYTIAPGTDMDQLTPQILAARPNALVVTSARLTSDMARACRQHGIRVVLLNRIQSDVRVNAVACDNHAGGRDAATFLMARGRRRIGFIGGIVDTSTHRDRAAGFREALQAGGQSLFAEAAGGYSYRGGYVAAQAMLTQKTRPDAVFCCNDIMALAAIDAARELGLSTPDDLSVIGFDDIPMAKWTSYRLTTIRQPITRMINEVVNLIEAGAAVPIDDTATSILPGKLMVRGSA